MNSYDRIDTLEQPPLLYAIPEQELQAIPSVDWWITSRCNLACDFCYGPEPAKDPAELLDTIADQLAASSAETITFCGGEPLVLGEAVFRYARMFREAGKRVVLNTNGELFEQAVQRFLKPGEQLPFDVIGFSIEGATQETHALMRGNRASLANTFRSVQLAKAYGANVKVATVVSGVNKDKLPHLARLVQYELRPDVWRLYQYNPNGAYNHGQIRHHISKEDFTQAIAHLRKVASSDLPIYPSDNESQNCLIVDPLGQLTLSTEGGYEVIGSCIDTPVNDMWLSEPEIVRGMVARNKRWIGAAALGRQEEPETSEVPDTHGARGANAERIIADLRLMQTLAASAPEAFKNGCLSGLPEGLSAEYVNAYWRRAFLDFMQCDTTNLAEADFMANRFMFYYYEDRYAGK